jgi:hypothetical protein
MGLIRSTADLVQGAIYELPDGRPVVAAASSGTVVCALLNPPAGRVYGIDPAERVRQVYRVATAGVWCRVVSEDGYGALTGFTVQDLRPVADD